MSMHASALLAYCSIPSSIMYRQLLSVILLAVIVVELTSGLPWQLAHINTNSDLTFPSFSSTTEKPDAWKDRAALGLLDSGVEGSGYAADAPSDDSDLEGSGAPKIFLKSDAQFAPADQANGSLSSVSGGSSSYPANFASTLQQDGAVMTFPVVDNSTAKVDSQVDVGMVLGYVDRASVGFTSQSPADDVVAVYISLKNGKTASGTLTSLNIVEDVLMALYGTGSVELASSTLPITPTQSNATQSN
ncbi:hypothetical protein RvY_00531-1 [Ramazzottius varieornatus]|uniref:Uncharacterized protein n=1 Tax=Ramazzottius varieornatus TaxID=947166 RepID=A0A1D1UJD6_RAMVA|nr:hypothetical protein RvY_00531-1 [Ramazzottius varieornatus]